ncbi:hypothetical protein Tco_0688092 [Tanacetum coccineum]
MLKKFDLQDSKPMKTPMFPDTKLTKDEECESVDSAKYRGMKRSMFVEFVIQNQFFSYSLEEFAQILDIPCEGACVFTDRWRLDELAYDGQVRRIRHEEEIDVLEYQVLTHEIEPTLKPLEEIIRENCHDSSCRSIDETQSDRGMRRGRHSISSSSAFNQPSSSHLNDDDDDGNDEGTSRASIPSPIRYVNSLPIKFLKSFKPPT